MPDRRLNRRRAFTAVELLAATALTAVLMVTLLHVIGSIGRGREAMRRRDAGEPVRTELLDALRWDLANARSASFGASGLSLVGHGSLDRDTLAPLHVPVTVSYRVLRLAGRSWLVREQAPAGNEQGAGGAWIELLCPDVRQVSFAPVARRGRVGRPETWSSGNVPAGVRVQLETTGGLIVDEELVLR
jgi:hypothetical protein